MKNLDPIPYPIYFIQKDIEQWADLTKREDLPDDMLPVFKRCVEGTHIWGIQTYLFLKQRGLDVRLSKQFVPGEICIAPYPEVAIKDFAFDSYVVGCRLDSPSIEICEQQTVLNKMCVNKRTDHFLFQWSQSNLKSRNSERGTQLKNLAFKGTLNNLADPFKTPDFLQQLSQMDIQFDMAPDLPKSDLYDFWRDYSTADAVLAIRLMSKNDFTLKPPIKLMNAWLAGCPALLGPEPAYRDLRRSELDYIEIRSPQDVIQALARLKENPDLYTSMVQNGLERSKEFTEDMLSLAWRRFLDEKVIPDYERWLSQSFLEKRLMRPLLFIQKAIRHKQEYKRYVHERDSSEKVYGL
jgi:hypothetical protein